MPFCLILVSERSNLKEKSLRFSIPFKNDFIWFSSRLKWVKNIPSYYILLSFFIAFDIDSIKLYVSYYEKFWFIILRVNILTSVSFEISVEN